MNVVLSKSFIEASKPLSLSIKSVPMKQITYSDILNSLISEASSAMCAPYLEPQTPLKSLNRSNYENFPFLRPPLTPERTKIPPDNIYTTPVAKRTLTSPSTEFSSPSKRSRLLDSAPFRSPLSKKKLPKHLAGDVASLLQSPPIPRRSSKYSKGSLVKNSPATAPQGILKKKAEPNKFPSSDFFTSKTPSVLSDAGEDTDNEDDIEMNVDDSPLDNQGRQIRFSVPSKEDLNASMYSNVSTESGVSNVSHHEPSTFMKKLEELKPLPSLEPTDFHSREFLNVTQRKTLLTREPLKSHSKVTQSPHKILTLEENNQIAHEKSSTIKSTSFLSRESFQQDENIKRTSLSHPVEESDSDSYSDLDDNPQKDDYKVTSHESSNLMHSSSATSSAKIAESNLLISATSVESPLNKSGSSSSGNSSYNSASERSFIITPRRPLRDNSRDEVLPATSTLSIQEDEKNQALSAKEEPEEMIIDDTDDNDDNTDAQSSDGEEVSIIREVSSLEKNAEQKEQPMEEECIFVGIPDSDKAASHSSEDVRNSDFRPVPEESLEIEQVFDSHDRNANQLRDNNVAMHNLEQYNDFQNDFYNADQFSSSYNQMCFMEHLNVNQNSNNDQFNANEMSSGNVTGSVEQSNYIQNKIHSTEQSINIQNQIDNTVQSVDIQNQIDNIERPVDVQNKIDNIEWPVDVQNQIDNAEQPIDVQNQIDNTEQPIDVQNQIDNTEQPIDVQNKIDNTEQPIDIQNKIDNTEQPVDIQSQIDNTDQPIDIQNDNVVQSIDTQNQIDHTDQCSKVQIQVVDNNFCSSQSQITTIEQISDNWNQVSAKLDSEAGIIETVKDDIKEKIIDEGFNKHQSDSNSNDQQVTATSDHAIETVQEEKTGTDCVIKMHTDSTEVLHVDESTESCSSEIFNLGKDVPVSIVKNYIPIKERIRSQQSTSRSSKFDDDDDDQNYSSLLLPEQSEIENLEKIWKTGKLAISKKPSSSKSEKLENIAESSQGVGTNFHLTDSANLTTASSTAANSAKDISQRLAERFDFLSKNSEFYENNKLYRETMALLKSDMPCSFDFDVDKKISRKNRKFVFKKEEEKAETKTEAKPQKKIESKTETKSEAQSGKQTRSPKKFLESWHPETYEQFSSLIQKGRSNAGQKETLKSSPDMNLQKSSISIFEEANENEQSTSRAKGRRKQESTSKDSSLDKKELSSIKKAKGKGKSKKKIEFSFAEPHSHAGPEVLEALTTPSQYPVGSFMFSPPLTRGKLRQKRMDDTLGSSFASVVSETSFAKEKKPPVDPILQGIIDERAPETQRLLTSSSKKKTKASPKKKTASKKSDKIDVSQLELSDVSIDTSRMIEIDSPAIAQVQLPLRQTTKHRMVLRQTKTKSRTEQLF